MKILFIYPCSGSQLGFNYGVTHISSILKLKGHDVSFIQLCEDLAPLPNKELFLSDIKKENPHIIAFSVVTNQWEYTKQLASWIKEECETPIILGGVHALADPENILKTKLFDYIIRGEAEDAFLDFIENFSNKTILKTMKNIGYMENDKPHLNPLRPLPVLENLPPKDYSIMDFQKMIDAKNGWVGIMASRGCPFSCTYCFNHKMVEVYRNSLKCSFKDLNYIRRFPVKDVINEIKYLLNNYKRISMFIFDDDLFTFDKEYVKDFCNEYKKICKLPFVVNAHVGCFDEETAYFLKEANCQIVKFGIESGSPQIRKKILNRHMSNNDIINAINYVEKHKMHSSTFIIIGFPHETEENIYETVKLVAKAKPGRFRWTYFFPYPGTKAHEIAFKGNYINIEKMEKLSNFTDESCLEFSKEHNFFLKKVGLIFPWFVNAYSDLPVSDFYKEKINEILNMNEKEWDELTPKLRELDKSYSQNFTNKKLSHYAIKYNRFMGVSSDYFLNES